MGHAGVDGQGWSGQTVTGLRWQQVGWAAMNSVGMVFRRWDLWLAGIILTWPVWVVLAYAATHWRNADLQAGMLTQCVNAEARVFTRSTHVSPALAGDFGSASQDAWNALADADVFSPEQLRTLRATGNRLPLGPAWRQQLQQAAAQVDTQIHTILLATHTGRVGAPVTMRLFARKEEYARAGNAVMAFSVLTAHMLRDRPQASTCADALAVARDLSWSDGVVGAKRMGQVAAWVVEPCVVAMSAANHEQRTRLLAQLVAIQAAVRPFCLALADSMLETWLLSQAGAVEEHVLVSLPPRIRAYVQVQANRPDRSWWEGPLSRTAAASIHDALRQVVGICMHSPLQREAEMRALVDDLMAEANPMAAILLPSFARQERDHQLARTRMGMLAMGTALLEDVRDEDWPNEEALMDARTGVPLEAYRDAGRYLIVAPGGEGYDSKLPGDVPELVLIVPSGKQRRNGHGRAH